MSNLATMIMEGTNFGSVKLDRHYDHENGAGLISMESAEALRDIFETSFYVPNTCLIQAAMEGVSVEESSQASVMENAITDAFKKIADFFVKLKEKVKEFLHNIGRYLAGIFANDEKWVSTYAKDLDAIKGNLGGYKVKMYNYTIDQILDKQGIADSISGVKSKVESEMNKVTKAAHGSGDDPSQKADEAKEELDKTFEEEINNIVGKKVDDDEVDKEIWSAMRGGAKDESDKDEVAVDSIISKAVEALKNSKKVLDKYTQMVSDTDKAYNDIITMIKKEQSRIEKLKDGVDDVRQHDTGRTRGYDPITNTAQAVTAPNKYGAGGIQDIKTVFTAMTQVVSKIQNIHNKRNNAAKSAYVERNKVYRSALTGAFGYARKNKGGK